MAQSVVGALRVNLGLDSAQFSKGLRGAQRTLRSTARQMRNVGAAMSVAVTTPLLVAGRDMIRLAAVQEDAMNVVRKGVETTGNAAGISAQNLFDMASGLQEVTRFGDEDILRNVTAQLQTFTNVTGDEFARAQEAILDVATVMDTDLKSTALQLGKALNDPVKGLGALSRSGIQFTKDQKDVIESMVEMGDVAGAQQVILDELAKQFGGQARAAAETFQGKVDSLSNTWGDLKEEFGAILIEFLPPLLDGLRDLIEWIRELDPQVKEMGVKFGLVAAALGPVVSALGLFVIGITAIGTPVALALAGIAGLVAVFFEFKPEILAAKDAVIEFGRDALEYIKGFPEEIIQYFSELPAKMLQIGKDIVDGLKQGIAAKWQELKDYAYELAGALPDWMKKVLGIQSPSRVFAEIGQDIMDGLLGGLQGGAASVQGYMNQFSGEITEGLEGTGVAASDAAGNIADTFATAFEGVITGAQSMKDALGDILADISGNLLRSGLNSLFGEFGLGDLFSFDGGGFTGRGPRSGGVDGKGGFGAILHPNETVIDHTKGQRMAGGGQVINIDARGAQEGVAEQIAAALRRERPGMVQQAVSATYERAREVPIG